MCPFCEGQEEVAGRELLAARPSGVTNGPGWQVRVVPNRLPVLRVESVLGEAADPLLKSLGGLGAHEVVIESPDHRATFATMTAEAVERVLWAWRERIRDLRRDARLKSFVVVKNVGAAAGATLDHPHSQLLALPLVPHHLQQEVDVAGAYYDRTTACLFCDVSNQEIARTSRIVAADDEVVVVVMPFASRVPFETWVLPRAHQASFDEAPDATLAAVGERLQDVMRRLHVALVSPPHTVLLHTAPVGEGAQFYHWRIEILPRLTPVSGLAFGGIWINPMAPEKAAEVLRAL
jgi:UDPglucose--hexose-1-phosphate uridylyltransferase